MDEACDDIPYLMRGVTRMTTESSVLISSSPYLNDAGLRDWIAYAMLRRNGADDPPENELVELAPILARVQHRAAIRRLIAEERARNGAFDAWLAERFVSTFTEDDLAACPPGSVGAILKAQIARGAHGARIVSPRPVSDDYDYILLRRDQTRWLEHIVAGASFDHFGEATVHFTHLANLFRHLDARLAGELAVFRIFAALRYIPRTILHYPQATMTLLQAIVRGRKLGLDSGPLFMARYEDVLNLSPEMARARLGLAATEEVDTSAASAIWTEAAPGPRPGDELVAQGRSRLLSNSKYLNHGGLRDWCARDMLRRNGADQASPAGGYEAIRMLEDDLHEDGRAEQLLEAERKVHPGLDRWLAEGRVPTFTPEDLAALPDGSLGRILHDYVVAKNFELDFHPPRPMTLYPRTRWMRGRSHDVEHILLGAGFDYLAEVIPSYYCIAQLHREFSPELAGELSQPYLASSLRYTVRTVLHYPQTWPTALDGIVRGIRAGLESDFNYMTDFEPYLHMSVPEARAALGIRGVEDIDTEPMSLIWGDASHHTLEKVSAEHAAMRRGPTGKT
jgi:ubiquinone biosynthesis protein COQ4